MSELAKRFQGNNREEVQFYAADYQRHIQDLRDMQAANWTTPPLEWSPCVKLKSTGEIMCWTKAFAQRPDLFANCDEDGSEDPASWRDRTPVSQPDEPPSNSVAHSAPALPEQPADTSVATEQAQEKTAPQPTAQQFKTYEAQHGPGGLVLPEQAQPTAVDALVKELFAANFKD